MPKIAVPAPQARTQTLKERIEKANTIAELKAALLELEARTAPPVQLRAPDFSGMRIINRKRHQDEE